MGHERSDKVLGRTHLGVGLIAGYGLCMALGLPNAEATPIMAGAAVGSLLPDIDHPESSFGRKVRIISIPINHILGHRGLTHSLVFVAITYVCALYFGSSVALAAALGVFTHLLLDMLNPSGVPLLYPVKGRLHILEIKTGSQREKLMFWLLLIIVIALMVYR